KKLGESWVPPTPIQLKSVLAQHACLLPQSSLLYPRIALSAMLVLAILKLVLVFETLSATLQSPKPII
ncbi:unnamed protein product, partial [Sphenostylis stenocarpa]